MPVLHHPPQVDLRHEIFRVERILHPEADHLPKRQHKIIAVLSAYNAESTLAVLDFLDARDRRLLSTYQEQTNRINKALEERARTRDDLQRMLRGD